MLQPSAFTIAPAGVFGQRSRESPTPSPSASVSPEREKVALNAAPPMMSAPILNQLGKMPPTSGGLSFRIQLCLSFENGVPVAGIGLGAESHKKLPSLRPTSGRKKYCPAASAIGGWKSMVILTACPVKAPSPPVWLVGDLK